MTALRSELASRRRALGYSQEQLAAALTVDRTTVGRWERGEVEPYAASRPALARLLNYGLEELDALIARLRGANDSAHGQRTEAPPAPTVTAYLDAGDPDEMIRRDFLRILAVAGTMTAIPSETPVGTEVLDDYEAMNRHLWRVYQLARSKQTVYPIVRDQLSAMTDAFSKGRDTGRLCVIVGDLFQLAGEVLFDADRYTDAAQCYTLAMAASKEARAYDLWACSLTRHAYVGLYERRHGDAATILAAAARVARRGDSALATRHWVAAVQAQAYAGLGDLDACQRALDEAEQVLSLPPESQNGGWLRFDGSRMAEERGARYVELGRLDLAEQALSDAMRQTELTEGPSFRRRGAVLTDLAVIGAKRRDVDQALTCGKEAVELARSSGSGYIARRLRSLRTELQPVARDARVAALDGEIAALCVA